MLGNATAISFSDEFLRRELGSQEMRLIPLPASFDHRITSPPESGRNRFWKTKFLPASHLPLLAPSPSVVFSLLCTLSSMEASARANQPVHPPFHGILIFREVVPRRVPFLFSATPLILFPLLPLARQFVFP